MSAKSKAQLRLLFAKEERKEIPKGTAKEFAHATPNIKALPEHVKKEQEKSAFVAAFVVGAAQAGITNPQDVAMLAEKFASDLSAKLNKQSSVVPETLGTMGTAALVGSVGIPAALGLGVGMGAGKLHNMTEEDDAQTLRLIAERNEYLRRLAQAKTNLKVEKLVKGTGPERYVPLT